MNQTRLFQHTLEKEEEMCIEMIWHTYISCPIQQGAAEFQSLCGDLSTILLIGFC